MKVEVGSRVFHSSRVFCIGRNYAAHARELGNDAPTGTPVVFMKPATSLVAEGPVRMPTHGSELHHEAELVVLVGRAGRPRDAVEARTFVAGLALGLDLTLRDVQRSLKAKGLPWERAKAFEESAPLGRFSPVSEDLALDQLRFECEVNGEVRQRGESSLMIFSIEALLVELGRVWALREGDLIFTGTPEGVAELSAGDVVCLRGEGLETARWTLVAP